jgi:hypothetical protein
VREEVLLDKGMKYAECTITSCLGQWNGNVLWLKYTADIKSTKHKGTKVIFDGNETNTFNDTLNLLMRR